MQMAMVLTDQQPTGSALWAEARLSEEPGARKPHAEMCAGRGRATAPSTATGASETRDWRGK